MYLVCALRHTVLVNVRRCHIWSQCSKILGRMELLAKVKACVRYFHLIFIFSPNDSPSKTMKKCFLFHRKSYFRSRDIQFFVFLSFPLFLPVGLCFRGWSKINLKVHDAINCLNKNLITFCLISWEGKKVWHWNFVHRWSIRQRTFL